MKMSETVNVVSKAEIQDKIVYKNCMVRSRLSLWHRPHRHY